MTIRTPDSHFEELERRGDRLPRWCPSRCSSSRSSRTRCPRRRARGRSASPSAVAAAAAAWIAWMVILHPGWAQRPWPTRIYFAGLIVFIAALTIRSPWFAFFTWIGFLQAFMLLTGAWRWVVSGIVAVFFGMAQAGGFHRPTPASVAIWILLGGVDLGLVGAFVMLGPRPRSRTRPARG